MNKTKMASLREGVAVQGRMKQGMQVPMQGASFSAGESVDVVPHRPGADIVIVASTQDPQKRVEMSLYQVEQFIS